MARRLSNYHQNMQKPQFDPGLTQQVKGVLRRAINKDGSFNVERRGTNWRDFHPYLLMINAPWFVFFGAVFAGYFIVNTIFAVVYYNLPAGEVIGTDAPTRIARFLNDFFFSAQTLTTVGYGTYSPHGFIANSFAALEALSGLMGFAIATGLLFGRVSKPSARIGFSERILVAPYQDRTSLQFRIVNLRSNVLIELHATAMLMTVEGPVGQAARQYRNLTLERESVYFFPLTWTVVHPIDESSPLFGMTPADLERLQAEVLILIKGFDDTFSQTVNARYSYRYDEIEWQAKFTPAFYIDGEGSMILDVDRVGEFEKGEAAATN